MTRPEWTYRTGEDGKAKPPPEGWPSWAAFNRYLADADGGRAPYRLSDPLTIRTYLEVASETP